jgi:hypothetical protein
MGDVRCRGLVSEVQMGDDIEEEGGEGEDEESDAKPGENVGAFVLAGRGRGNADDQVEATKEFCEERDHVLPDDSRE